MIARLGAFLRRSLEVSEAQEVSLEEELEALDAYLDVVRLRFGDRLAVTVDADPEVLGAAVPPLVLQPLVENALKHGLEPLERPGRLEVLARREGRAGLRLEVRDDGVGLPASVREGIGVRNTRDRLRQLYGAEGSLELRTREGGGTLASVSLPIRRGAAALAGAGAR
jgi:two-component system, LytTR family, sensor kinase